MIVTIEMPGGSLAQGELLSQYSGVAVIDTGRDVLTGYLLPRLGAGLQAQVRILGHSDTSEREAGTQRRKNGGAAE